MLSVAVLASTGTAGDALDNAFFVLGPEGSRAYLSQLRDTEAFFSALLREPRLGHGARALRTLNQEHVTLAVRECESRTARPLRCEHLQCHDVSMRTILPLFTIAYAVVAGLFGIAALVLMEFVFLELWAVVI